MDKPIRRLTNWLASYLEYADNTEAPTKFHMWTAISIIGAALSRKCWIKVGRFTLYPSFYIVFVAPPGIATKSTTAQAGINLLESSNTIRVYDGSTTWQALCDQLKEAERTVLITSGTGPEPDTSQSMCCLHLFASELGNLLSIREPDKIDKLVDIWDGKNSLKDSTRGAGELVIPRPYLNFLACTTPSWMTKNAGMYAIDGGFFSRTIFVYADQKEKIIAYPTLEALAEKLSKDLLHDLELLGQMSGEFVMTEGAIALGESWYEELWRDTPKHISSEVFQGYKSRRQAHLHKLCIVMSAATRSDKVIDEEIFMAADSVLNAMEMDLKEIYDAVSTSEKTDNLKWILKIVAGTGATGISKVDLFKALNRKLTWNDFEAGIQAAIFSREIKLVQKGNDIIIRKA